MRTFTSTPSAEERMVCARAFSCVTPARATMRPHSIATQRSAPAPPPAAPVLAATTASMMRFPTHAIATGRTASASASATSAAARRAFVSIRSPNAWRAFPMTAKNSPTARPRRSRSAGVGSGRAASVGSIASGIAAATTLARAGGWFDGWARTGAADLDGALAPQVAQREPRRLERPRPRETGERHGDVAAERRRVELDDPAVAPAAEDDGVGRVALPAARLGARHREPLDALAPHAADVDPRTRRRDAGFGRAPDPRDRVARDLRLPVRGLDRDPDEGRSTGRQRDLPLVVDVRGRRVQRRGRSTRLHDAHRVAGRDAADRDRDVLGLAIAEHDLSHAPAARGREV